MSQFDVLEESLLLGRAEERPHLDQVLGHLLVEFGFEPGHGLQGSGHRRFVEHTRGGEKGSEFLASGVDRGLTGEEARMVGHADLVNLLFLLGRQVQDIETAASIRSA